MKTLALICAAAALTLAAPALAQNALTPGANGTGPLQPNANGELTKSPGGLSEGRSSATDLNGGSVNGDLAPAVAPGAGVKNRARAKCGERRETSPTWAISSG